MSIQVLLTFTASLNTPVAVLSSLQLLHVQNRQKKQSIPLIRLFCESMSPHSAEYIRSLELDKKLSLP